MQMAKLRAELEDLMAYFKFQAQRACEKDGAGSSVGFMYDSRAYGVSMALMMMDRMKEENK